MVLPVRDQAAEQIRPAQKRAVGRFASAEHHMVAAAGTGVAAVEHELLGTEPAQMRILVQDFGNRDHVVPAVGRLHIDLDDAGIRCDLEHIQPRIRRRLVTLDPDRQIELGGRVLDRGDEIEVILDFGDRRHEDVDLAVPRLDRQRRPRDAAAIDGRGLPDDGLGFAAGDLLADVWLARRIGLGQLRPLGQRVRRHDIRVIDRLDVR
jgi:hypothetical protein